MVKTPKRGEKFYGFYFPESNDYCAFGAGKLTTSLRRIVVGETRPMKWDDGGIYDARCIMVSTQEEVKQLLKDLDEGVKTIDDLDLPDVVSTQPTPKAAARTPGKKSLAKKAEPKTPTSKPNRSAVRGLKRPETKDKEKIDATPKKKARRQEPVTPKSASRRKGKLAKKVRTPVSSRKKNAPPKKRGSSSPRRKHQKEAMPVSAADKAYNEALDRVEEAENGVEARERMVQMAEGDLVTAQKELENARLNLEAARQAKEEEDKMREEGRKAKEEEEKRMKEEKERQEEEKRKKKEEKEEEMRRLKKVEEEDKKKKEEEERKKEEEVRKLRKAMEEEGGKTKKPEAKIIKLEPKSEPQEPVEIYNDDDEVHLIPSPKTRKTPQRGDPMALVIPAPAPDAPSTSNSALPDIVEILE